MTSLSHATNLGAASARPLAIAADDQQRRRRRRCERHCCSTAALAFARGHGFSRQVHLANKRDSRATSSLTFACAQPTSLALSFSSFAEDNKPQRRATSRVARRSGVTNQLTYLLTRPAYRSCRFPGLARTRASRPPARRTNGRTGRTGLDRPCRGPGATGRRVESYYESFIVVPRAREDRQECRSSSTGTLIASRSPTPRHTSRRCVRGSLRGGSLGGCTPRSRC